MFDAAIVRAGTTGITEGGVTQGSGCRRVTTRDRVRAQVPASKEGAVDALEGELAGLAGTRNRVDAAIVGLVTRALADDLWCQSGILTPAHWVAWRLGCDPTRAQRLVAVARRAPELPTTIGALEAGELSFEQVEVIAKHVPASHERSAAEVAREMTVSQLRRTLPRYAFETAADEDDHPEGLRPPARQCSTGTDDRGWRMRAGLPDADEGAIVDRALRAARENLWQARKAEDDGDHAARVSLADALVEVASSYLAAGQHRQPDALRFRVLAHLEADPTDPGAPGVMRLHQGPVLPDALRELVLCDADVVTVRHVDGKPVDVGRAQRIVPDRTRILVEHRDGGCRVPGCTGRQVVVHHLVHWEHGGPTVTWNLVALCPTHHRLVHAGALHITGNADDPDGLVFTDGRGRQLDPAARPRPPGTLPTGAPYRHPRGEHLDHRCFHLQPDPRPARTAPRPRGRDPDFSPRRS